MRGIVLDYDPRNGEGLISGDDNHRYKFRGTSVKSDFSSLKSGARVDFDPGNGEAFSIFVLRDQAAGGINIDINTSGEKSKVVAGLLAIFLGGFGIHKFYLGYNKAGIVMLLFTMFGFLFFGIPGAIIWLIGLIEGVIYISKSDQDFFETYVAHQKEWF
ncbi:TM2 domain-containing protein [Gluconacetobacter sp. 1b LMG 1731]|uniref:TM2 domain-containing protein n=1 Tax=Gluconacetobacter dulcium TaxID=2729096 RepID=A0A7W4NWD4_9PROT|nr:TM2 domain-containing protein [Gluconacetobacter dulcium]MBB2166348.1 TM2 domain-containing protein [Gluconacetobacter dulcium]MBB2195486.1 TM2 domain-containing protein [Gluconacetobacter dulcium]